eukprot:TRINITY_DN5822_c0_g1_i1.p1 TRINITY_DN5822_c0_g1~~TRINITY_DN5822_c0_g1_i1.p1  ORF type:complete len:254 (+),score=23.77 TRINITY_DN5822_c0_g1_i1:102-764(+)
MDVYMKLVGLSYLQDTLRETIEKVYAQKKSCEVDPQKFLKGKDKDIKKNFILLRSLTENLIQCIFASVNQCPLHMRLLFKHIQERVKERYAPEKIQTTRYTAISGFIFLRFFCPAIISPKIFGLHYQHPEPPTARTLTLIAKTIQNLANLVEFGSKEPYMKEMNSLILENIDHMKTFLDSLANIGEGVSTGVMIREHNIDLQREMGAIFRYLKMLSLIHI